MMNFSFNTDNFGKYWLPIALRKERVLAFVKVILRPFKVMHSEFSIFVNEKRNEYKYTGRTISLRNMLIDRFGAGIIVENQPSNGDPYLVNESGDALNWQLGASGSLLNPQVGASGSAVLDDVDFIVKVPAALGADLNEVRGLVNKYKVAGMTFNVVNI